VRIVAEAAVAAAVATATDDVLISPAIHQTDGGEGGNVDARVLPRWHFDVDDAATSTTIEGSEPVDEKFVPDHDADGGGRSRAATASGFGRIGMHMRRMSRSWGQKKDLAAERTARELAASKHERFSECERCHLWYWSISGTTTTCRACRKLENKIVLSHSRHMWLSIQKATYEELVGAAETYATREHGAC
jgi:hypothetical protein